MLAEFASVLTLLAYSQDLPPQPVPGDPPSSVGDIDVSWRPDTILCVRAERAGGSRIRGGGECRSIAEWRVIQVARVERYATLMKYSGKYVVDSGLEEEALSRMSRIRLESATRR